MMGGRRGGSHRETEQHRVQSLPSPKEKSQTRYSPRAKLPSTPRRDIPTTHPPKFHTQQGNVETNPISQKKLAQRHYKSLWLTVTPENHPHGLHFTLTRSEVLAQRLTQREEGSFTGRHPPAHRSSCSAQNTSKTKHLVRLHLANCPLKLIIDQV
jgi:hypothetical protein